MKTLTPFPAPPRRLRVAAVLLPTLLMIPLIALVAFCVPKITSSIDVNGVVSSTSVPGGAAGCMADVGWGGVVSQAFTTIDPLDLPADPADHPHIFLAGEGSLNNFYIGVHIPYDPGDLQEQDRLTLYFDADNSGSFGAGDFALSYDVGTTTPQTTGEDCNFVPGEARFHEHDGANWDSGTTTIPAWITHNGAYDYDVVDDAETGLWEFEIGIDVSVAGGFGFALAAGGFGIGAKLYVHEFIAGDTWLAWNWPDGLTTEDNPLAYEPDFGSVTPANLASVNFGSCADVEILSISSVAGDGGANNEFRRPEPGDFDGAGNLPVNLQNEFLAEVRFFNPSDPADMSPVAVPNSGNVRFSVRPWASGAGFLSTQEMENPVRSFDHLGQVETVSIKWPLNNTSDYTAAVENDFDTSNHICLKVELNGYTVNLGTDIKSRNLTYATLSTRVDTLLVSTRGLDFPDNAQVLDYLMRINWRNVPQKDEEGWSYRILNAEELGMEEVGDGYYSFEMRQREDKLIALEMSGGNMPSSLQVDEYVLSPRAGGTLLDPSSGEPPLDIHVEPGKMITILAQGEIQVMPQNESLDFNGANGFSNRRFERQRFLLTDAIYTPYHYIGAVIGSFDGFRTAFRVGADASFIVPEGATRLSLAVNDVAGQYDDNQDKGFELHVLSSEPAFLPTRLASPGNPAAGQPANMEPGGNLPLLAVDVFQAFPVEPVNDDDVENPRVLVPSTYVNYAIYASSLEDDGDGDDNGGGGCGFGSGQGAVLFLVFVFGGGLLMQRRDRRRIRMKKANHPDGGA